MIQLLIAVWLGVNAAFQPFHPHPSTMIGYIGTVLTAAAALQGPLILLTQRQETARDRAREIETFRVATNIEADLHAIRPSAAGAIASILLGMLLLDRPGARPVLVIGMAVTAAGLALLGRLQGGGSFLVDLLPAMPLAAVGQGAAFTVGAASSRRRGPPRYRLRDQQHGLAARWTARRRGRSHRAPADEHPRPRSTPRSSRPATRAGADRFASATR